MISTMGEQSVGFVKFKLFVQRFWFQFSFDPDRVICPTFLPRAMYNKIYVSHDPSLPQCSDCFSCVQNPFLLILAPMRFAAQFLRSSQLTQGENPKGSRSASGTTTPSWYPGAVNCGNRVFFFCRKGARKVPLHSAHTLFLAQPCR